MKQQANQNQRAHNTDKTKTKRKYIKKAFYWVIKIGMWIYRFNNVEEWFQSFFFNEE